MEKFVEWLIVGLTVSSICGCDYQPKRPTAASADRQPTQLTGHSQEDELVCVLVLYDDEDKINDLIARSLKKAGIELFFEHNVISNFDVRKQDAQAAISTISRIPELKSAKGYILLLDGTEKDLSTLGRDEKSR